MHNEELTNDIEYTMKNSRIILNEQWRIDKWYWIYNEELKTHIEYNEELRNDIE